ncbi:MAG TPA: hypothetical protein VIM14_20785 [Polyangia bacterium]
MTDRFRALSLMALAGASVLVFHTAAFAQQAQHSQQAKDEPAATTAPATKDAEATKAETAPEAPAKPEQAQDLPPEYAPPPGYHHGSPPMPPPNYPPPGYGPYYQDYYYGPGYPPPPRFGRARYYQPAAHYYPDPLSYRPFFFGVGLGVGGVAVHPVSGGGKDSSRAGMSYNLHFGFGISPRWSIVLAGDGAYSYFDGFTIDESVWSIGPQVFITPHLYARMGIGVATKSIDDNSYYDSGFSDSGLGWTAALGFEFLQTYHTAIGLELAATAGHFANADIITNSKNEGTIGINFILNLF